MNMKTSLLLLSLCAIVLIWTGSAYGQTSPDTVFSRLYGGEGDQSAYSVCQTTAGGFALAGSTAFIDSTGTLRHNAYLIVTDSAGSALFTRSYGDTLESGATAVRQTMDGGFILVGSIRLHLNTSTYIVRTNSVGDTVWTEIISDSTASAAADVQVMADGSYIVTGYAGLAPGGLDFYAMRITEASERDSIVWRQIYASWGSDESRGIVPTADGGFIMIGSTDRIHPSVAYVVKVDRVGNFEWDNTYSTGTWGDAGLAIRRTCAGNYIILLRSTDSVGTRKACLLMIDQYGNVIHSSICYSSPIGSSTVAWNMDLCADGGVIVATETYPPYPHRSAYVVRTDSNFELLWDRIYRRSESADEAPYAVAVTKDGGFVLAGSSGQNDYDALLLVTQPEPLGLTAEPDSLGSAAILRWRASQSCVYSIYGTTNPDNDNTPPGQGWTLLTTEYAICVPPMWIDSVRSTTFKAYIVVRECP